MQTEFVVNLLDLASFALVTPELVRFVRPGAAYLVAAPSNMAVTWLIIMLLSPLYVRGINALDMAELRQGPIAFAAFVLYGGVFGGVLMLLFRRPARALAAAATRPDRLFLAGVALFGVARVIALVETWPGQAAG